MSYFNPVDERGRRDDTKFWGLYRTAREQGVGRLGALVFARRHKRYLFGQSSGQ